MRLIGMLDSPYVRRVAISLKVMALPFEHQSLSVFRDFDAFAKINPIVKAPTLVTDDGSVLLDSTLILEYLERLAAPERRLTPLDLADHIRSQRAIGLALAACEKTVQIVYEFNLRPVEKQHQAWVDRVKGQLSAAYDLLEAEFADVESWRLGSRPLQADITTAVAWRFTQDALPQFVLAASYPALSALSQRAEALPEFIALSPD